MRLACWSLAVVSVLATSCSGDPKIREDRPEHLVEDLARAFRAAAVEWLDEENAADAGPEGMGAVASQNVTAGVIRYQRMLERGRALCDRWLPPEAQRMQAPESWSPRLRAFAVALALAAPEEIVATAAPTDDRSERQVTLRIGKETWTLRLRPVKKTWVFSSGPHRPL